MQLYVWFDYTTSCVTLGKLLISVFQFLYLKNGYNNSFSLIQYLELCLALCRRYVLSSITIVHAVCDQSYGSAEKQMEDEPFTIHWNSTVCEGPARDAKGMLLHLR